uniref:Uncharacterized protein n=1 Tax=Hyaloperonospora arabidopsidis (strain Emoy2) TaxID=559515 RepID=M4C1X5_HYAAE
MSTIRYSEFGHPLTVLRTEADDKETAPAKGQVALRFLAAPINVSDLSQIQGSLIRQTWQQNFFWRAPQDGARQFITRRSRRHEFAR